MFRYSRRPLPNVNKHGEQRCGTFGVTDPDKELCFFWLFSKGAYIYVPQNPILSKNHRVSFLFSHMVFYHADCILLSTY